MNLDCSIDRSQSPEKIAARFIRLANRSGTHQVFETALFEGIEFEALAMVVKGLLKIQNTPRKNWTNGVPDYWSHQRHCYMPQSQAFSSPKGILGEYKEPMVKVAIKKGKTNKWIKEHLGVDGEYVNVRRRAGTSQA